MHESNYDTSLHNRCVIPEERVDDTGDNRWLNMHQRYVLEAKTSEAEVLFLGDSIIQQLQLSSIWNEKINSLHCLNFGIGGDRVEHVLWRVLNGELDFTTPVKVVVVLVGTNNLDSEAQDVYDGICEIVKTIKLKMPKAEVLLLTLLPRGQNPSPHRDRNMLVNNLLIERFRHNRSSTVNIRNRDSFGKVHVMTIHDDIIQSDETISHHIMHDYLHLTNQGYAKVFGPVYEKLQLLLHNGVD